MCTVSFVASGESYIFTSNRDEQVLRAATEPKYYLINNTNLYFPKDPLAGGTWYCANQNGTILVLLNGATEKHQHQPPYNRSRGLVVLELITNNNSIAFWDTINLHKVEPFTIILFQNNKLYQLRWDEICKTKIELDTNLKHIWSSSTLYPKEIREQRARWFMDYTNKIENINNNDLLDFHQNTHNENHENGLVINRNDKLKTLSITQTVIQKKTIKMIYKDLINFSEHEINFEIQ